MNVPRVGVRGWRALAALVLVLVVLGVGGFSSTSVRAAAAASSNVPLGATVVAGGGRFGAGAIFRDSSGTMWIANMKGNSIIRVGAHGALTTYRSPKILHPTSLAEAADGAIWFTEPYGAIGRLATSGVVSIYGLGKVRWPTSIVAGPDGDFWFTEFGGVGRIAPSGELTLFAVPHLGGTELSNVGNIVVGPDRKLWFTAYRTTRKGKDYNRAPFRPVAVRIDRVGKFTEFPIGAKTDLLQSSANLASFTSRAPFLANGPDHRLWATAGQHAVIAVTITGRVTKYTSSRLDRPTQLVGGSGGVWVANRANRTINWISPKGVVRHSLPLPSVTPDVLAGGAAHTLWFGQVRNGVVGKVTTTSGKATLVAPLVAQPKRLTAGGNGDVWFQNTANGTLGRRRPDGWIEDYWGPALAGLTEMVWGPDHAMWFIRQGKDSVSRITSAGKVTVISNKALKDPQMIVSGPKGAIWVLLGNKKSVAQITPAGSVTLFALPSKAAWIAGRAASPLWWVGFSGTGTLIGRLTPGGAARTTSCACQINPYERPLTGPDGALWFDTNPSTGTETLVRVGLDGDLTTGAPAGLVEDAAPYVVLNANQVQYESSDSGRHLAMARQTLGDPEVLSTVPPVGLNQEDETDNGAFVDLVSSRDYGEAPSAVQPDDYVDPVDTGDIGPDGNLWFATQNLILRTDPTSQ